MALMDDAGPLRLRVLGGFALERPSNDAISIVNRKACGLLAYLAIAQTSGATREQLAGLLWSDSDESRARASLRQCLKQLRAIFGDIGFAGFKTQRQDIVVAAPGFSVDLQVVAEELANGQIPPLLLERGGRPDRILYGYENLDPSFAAWLHVVRQSWHDRLVDALQDIIRRPLADGVHAKQAAQALANIDPTHEEAQRHLIRHYADDGNIAAALKQYKLLWDLLAEEYDMEPAKETADLIAEIKAGSYVPASPARQLTVVPSVAGAATTQSRLPVIGVSRFLVAGPGSHAHYLVEGFRREVIASLIRFREWVVVDAPRHRRGVATADDERAESPGEYRLEGTFVEAPSTARLVITLKDVVTQRYIWSEQILLTLENWFDAQQDIVRRVATALNIYLSVDRLDRNAGRPGVSLDVYDRWLRGQELTLEWRPGAHADAREVFKAILDETPDFGRAVSSLVQLENATPLVYPGIFRTKERCLETVQLAKRAVQIDPLDSRAQLCLAWAYAINAQFDHAEIHFGLACDLNQNDPWTLVSSALGWAFCNRIEIAQRLSEQALSLGFMPSKSHWGYIATIKFLSADYGGCIAAIAQADNALFNLPAWSAAALYHLGRQAEATAEARRFLDLIRQHWTGPTPATDEAIAEWLLQCFPIRDLATWRRLRDGLRGAGVPIADHLNENPAA